MRSSVYVQYQVHRNPKDTRRETRQSYFIAFESLVPCLHICTTFTTMIYVKKRKNRPSGLKHERG